MRSRLPVLRERKRYLAFEAETEGPVTSRDLISEFHSTYVSLFGDVGVSVNRVKLISFQGRFGILMCWDGHVEETRAALATIYAVSGIRVAIRVLGVSGTVKAATEKYIPKLSQVPAVEDRRIELEEISGWIAHSRGNEIDVSQNDHINGSDTRYLGLTCFDLDGGCDDADGTSNGL